jgi:hypothetical protein
MALSGGFFALLVILAASTGGCTVEEATAIGDPENGQLLTVEEPTAIGDPENGQLLTVEEPTAIGDPKNGQLLYELGPEGVYEQFCASCHRLSDLVNFGPGFEGIADRAATQVSGLSAEEYLRQSIVEPKAYIVEGDWGGAVMPTNYGEEYSEEDINDLIAFLLTQ